MVFSCGFSPFLSLTLPTLAVALSSLTLETFASHFQVSPQNPCLGLAGRFQLLKRLGTAISDPKNIYFSNAPDLLARPSNILHYLFPGARQPAPLQLSVSRLWMALMNGLRRVWPETRTRILVDGCPNAVSLGDAWPSSLLLKHDDVCPIVPFHKLTQWMCYSLLEPLERCLHVKLTDVSLLTALPEYRNGGLLVDFGVLTLKEPFMTRGLKHAKDHRHTDTAIPLFEASDEVVVQWRALTVCVLDTIAEQLREKLGFRSAEAFPLAKVLEAGTWKAGREIAKHKRPATRGAPPINIISDGTVF